MDQLTGEEQVVVALVVEGLTNDAIAAQIGTSVTSVEATLRGIYDRHKDECGGEHFNRRCWLVRQFTIGRWDGDNPHGRCRDCLRRMKVSISICPECGESMERHIDTTFGGKASEHMQMVEESHQWAEDLNQKNVTIKPQGGRHKPITGVAVRDRDLTGGWGSIRIYLAQVPDKSTITTKGVNGERYAICDGFKLQYDETTEYWYHHLPWKDRARLEVVDSEYCKP